MQGRSNAPAFFWLENPDPRISIQESRLEISGLKFWLEKPKFQSSETRPETIPVGERLASPDEARINSSCVECDC
jgi:hypothetical protein